MNFSIIIISRPRETRKQCNNALTLIHQRAGQSRRGHLHRRELVIRKGCFNDTQLPTPLCRVNSTTRSERVEETGITTPARSIALSKHGAEAAVCGWDGHHGRVSGLCWGVMLLVLLLLLLLILPLPHGMACLA